MKKAFCLLLAVMLCVGLWGCNPTTTYTCQELTISLPKGMQDVTNAEENLGLGFHFALENDTLFVCGIRQDFLDLDGGASMTIDDYTHQLMELYDLEGNVLHGQREGKDYVYISFIMPLENGVNQYLCGVYKSSGAFWLIQMNTLTKHYNEETFYGYLDSVKLS